MLTKIPAQRLQKYISNYFVILCLYVLFSIFLFKDIVLNPGIIAGNDWGQPATISQVYTSFNNSLNTWTDQGILFGARQSILTTIPYQTLVVVLTKIGLTPDLYSRIFIVTLFSLAALSLHSLLRYFKLNVVPAFLSGLFYITTPTFFNYSIMGWTFVLMYFTLIAWIVLFFIKAVKENNFKFSILSGILFAFSIIQSQSIFWTTIILASLFLYLVRDRKMLFLYMKHIVVVYTLFLCLNLYWAFGLILIKDANIYGSDILNSDGSVATMGRFTPINFIRLFGSLFNFQYEYAIGNLPDKNYQGYSLVAFVTPLIVFLSLFIKKQKILIRSFWLLALVPISLYLINYYRSSLEFIPFVNVIRDFPRFSVISTFAYAVLFGFSIDWLFVQKRKIGLIALLLWFISIFPWWRGEISAWQNMSASDVRMRSKVFPPGYIDLEKMLSSENETFNVLYFPTYGILDFTDDEKFHGTYRELVDVFAAYTTHAGSIFISDRGNGYLTSYLRNLNQYTKPNFQPEFFDALKRTNIKYVVIRKNITFEGFSDIKKVLENLDGQSIKKYYENENVVVYKINDYYPRIYSSSEVVVTSGGLNNIDEYNQEIVVFTENNNLSDKVKIGKVNGSQLMFKKINSAKYRVHLIQADGLVPIVLNQTFHDQWKLYFSSLQEPTIIDESNNFSETKGSFQNDQLANGSPFETIGLKRASDDSHLIANGWSNVWFLDVTEICQKYQTCYKNEDGSYDLELILEFYPQRIYLYGASISIFTLFLALIYLCFKKNK